MNVSNDRVSFVPHLAGRLKLGSFGRQSFNVRTLQLYLSTGLHSPKLKFFGCFELHLKMQFRYYDRCLLLSPWVAALPALADTMRIHRSSRQLASSILPLRSTNISCSHCALSSNLWRDSNGCRSLRLQLGAEACLCLADTALRASSSCLLMRISLRRTAISDSMVMCSAAWILFAHSVQMTAVAAV